VACLLAAYSAVLLVYSPLTRSLIDGQPGEVALADFGSFYASGQAAAQGLDPYGVYPLTMDAALGAGHGAAVNLNAPLSVSVFQLFIGFDPASARLGWFLVSIAAYAISVVLLVWTSPGARDPLRVVAPFALAGFTETLDLGQVYAVLALWTTLALLLMRRRPLVAAILLGFVAAFKPNFLVWPVVLVVVGARRIGLAALAAAVGFSVLPVLQFGPGIYAQWLSALGLEQVNPQMANASIAGAAVRLGLPGQIGVALAGVGAVLLLVWLRRTPTQPASLWALAASLLCSPLAWVGYTAFLLPVFFAARWSLALAVGAALLCAPRLLLQPLADSSTLLRLTVGNAYTLGWLLLLAAMWMSQPKSDEAYFLQRQKVVTGL
jgi:hypothetical protein